MIVEHLRAKDGNDYAVEYIGDTAAGLQGLMLEMAFLVSYFVGPLLCEEIGFRETADVHLGLYLVEIMLLLFCGGLLSKKGKSKTKVMAENEA